MKWIFLLMSLPMCSGAAERVVINEIHFDPAERKPLKFVELFNAGDTPATRRRHGGGARRLAPE